jgi:hypothetical protein
VPGNGIGLALVQAIAERHGGQATLHSTPGHGAIARISLPMVPCRAKQPLTWFALLQIGNTLYRTCETLTISS